MHNRVRVLCSTSVLVLLRRKISEPVSNESGHTDCVSKESRHMRLFKRHMGFFSGNAWLLLGSLLQKQQLPPPQTEHFDL